MCYNNDMDSKLYRIMCIDYGDVRIGIALTDPTRTIASAYENYNRVGTQADLAHIADIVTKMNVQKIVFGMPYSMDGKENDRMLATKSFAEQLQAITKVEIDYFDERFTSIVAEKMLISADVSRGRRKQVLDKLSATIILQDYLSTRS